MLHYSTLQLASANSIGSAIEVFYEDDMAPMRTLVGIAAPITSLEDRDRFIRQILYWLLRTNSNEVFKQYVCFNNMFLYNYILFINVASLQGDFGRLRPQLRRYKIMLNYWNRLVKMNDSRLTYCIIALFLT